VDDSGSDAFDARSRLREAVERLLDETIPAYSLRPEVVGLLEALAALAGFAFDRRQSLGDGDIRTLHGLAISPGHAALCGEDFVRTVTFLRGVAAALARAQQSRDGPVRVLYAGCGPYALLVLPLLTLPGNVDVRVTLLDLHPDSTRSVARLVRMLGLDEPVESIETVDATTFTIDPDRRPDVIVAEVMQAGLRNEPQVAVVRRLLEQAPDALLVPSAVRIDLVLIDPSREFDPDLDPSERRAGRHECGTVFLLDRERVLGWRNQTGDRLPGAALSIPASRSSGREAMLFTRIDVFGAQRLDAYQSGLTTPIRLNVDRWPVDEQLLRFRFRLGADPGLEATIEPFGDDR
jgi:hypothetical protein